MQRRRQKHYFRAKGWEGYGTRGCMEQLGGVASDRLVNIFGEQRQVPTTIRESTNYTVSRLGNNPMALHLSSSYGWVVGIPLRRPVDV